jgi:hypothetical protein
MELPRTGTVRFIARNFAHAINDVMVAKDISSLNELDRRELIRLLREAPSVISKDEGRAHFEVSATTAAREIVGPAYVMDSEIILRGDGHFFPRMDAADEALDWRLG